MTARPHRAHAPLLALLAAPLLGAAMAAELTLAMSAQPETLDPQATSATSSFQITKSLYDTLVEVGPDGALRPGLAESWEIAEDGRSVTFHLVRTTFHDGTPFDSADVAATLGRMIDEATASPKATEFAALAEVDTPDGSTVVLRLSEPAPALLSSLASGWGAMLPSERIEADHDFGTEPVGTGPFRLTEWVRDSHLRLEPNAGYHGGAPELDAVTVRFVPDSAVQLQGLMTGEFHVIDAVSAADAPAVEADPALELVREPSGMVLVASLNNRRPHLDDPRVRRALNLAIDKEAVLEVAYGGGTPVGTFMEAGSPWLPEGIEAYPYDPEAARALLEEAGVPDGWTLDIALPQSYPTHVEAGQMVQAMLQDVGVASELRMVEWGVWLAEVYGGPRDFDLTVIGHTGKLDPTGRLGGYGVESDNYVGYRNPEVSEWLATAAVASDPEERADLYARVLQAMHDDAPFLYFGTPDRSYARRAEVEGFWITPLLDTFDLRDARLTSEG